MFLYYSKSHEPSTHTQRRNSLASIVGLNKERVTLSIPTLPSQLPFFAPPKQLETHLITYTATLIQDAQCPLRQSLVHQLRCSADLSSVII